MRSYDKLYIEQKMGCEKVEDDTLCRERGTFTKKS